MNPGPRVVTTGATGGIVRGQLTSESLGLNFAVNCLSRVSEKLVREHL
jgi:hypothetical protein